MGESENEIEMGESENEELPTVIDFSIDNILPTNVTWSSHNRVNSIFSLIYGGLNNQQNNVYDPLNEVISNSFDEDKEAYKNVLSEKGKQQLKIINYNSTISKEKRCPITQEEFEENQEIIQLPCSHIFSKEAITKWLETESAKCPICRIELESKEILKVLEFTKSSSVLQSSDVDNKFLDIDNCDENLRTNNHLNMLTKIIEKDYKVVKKFKEIRYEKNMNIKNFDFNYRYTKKDDKFLLKQNE